MFGLIIFGVICFAAVILERLWRRPYPGAVKSMNIWFGPLPRQGENQIRYSLRDALFALALSVGLFLPALLLAYTGVEFGRSSSSPASLQILFAIFVGLAYLMAFNFAACILKALLMSLFRRRQVFNEKLGKFVTERSYR